MPELAWSERGKPTMRYFPAQGLTDLARLCVRAKAAARIPRQNIAGVSMRAYIPLILTAL